MARRLPEKNAKMHQGVWDKSAKGAHEVRGRRSTHIKQEKGWSYERIFLDARRTKECPL